MIATREAIIERISELIEESATEVDNMMGTGTKMSFEDLYEAACKVKALSSLLEEIVSEA